MPIIPQPQNKSACDDCHRTQTQSLGKIITRPVYKDGARMSIRQLINYRQINQREFSRLKPGTEIYILKELIKGRSEGGCQNYELRRVKILGKYDRFILIDMGHYKETFFPQEVYVYAVANRNRSHHRAPQRPKKLAKVGHCA